MMKASIVKSLVAVFVVAMLLAGVVIAQNLLKAVPVEVYIVTGNIEVTVYSDAELTIEIDSLYLGDLARGSIGEYDFYVKNTGVEDINITITVPEDVSSWAVIAIMPVDQPIFLSAGSHASCLLAIDVPITASLGTKSFTLEIMDAP